MLVHLHANRLDIPGNIPPKGEPKSEGPRSIGRPSQGITKKGLLTLTQQEWDEIKQSDQTVAAFLKDKMKRNGNVIRLPIPDATLRNDGTFIAILG